MVTRVRFALVPVLVLVPVLSAQQPTFSSATVRPSTAAPDARPVSRVGDDGGYIATNVTLKQLIEDALRRSGFDRREVTGGPDWIATERFDLTAHADGLVLDPDGHPRQSLRMLQALLADRFQLRWHVEEPLRPQYALVPAKNGPGPRLIASALDCVAVMQAFARGERGGKMCGAAPYPGRLTGAGLTMADLAGLMTPYLDRPVIDRTGLRGGFDIDLEGVEIQPKGPFGPSYRASDTTQSVFELLPIQLGLTLERVTAPIEVVVIERAERPARF